MRRRIPLLGAKRTLTNRWADQAGRVLQKAATKALAVRACVELEIAAPPEAEPDSHEAGLEAEVRAHLRTLNDKDRAAVFADPVKRDDMVTVAAVLRPGVPVMLTGMHDAEREARRREWQRSRYPVELDRVERVGKAIEAAERAATAVRNFAERVVESAIASRECN
jgi:hypothetical protein